MRVPGYHLGLLVLSVATSGTRTHGTLQPTHPTSAYGLNMPGPQSPPMKGGRPASHSAEGTTTPRPFPLLFPRQLDPCWGTLCENMMSGVSVGRWGTRSLSLSLTFSLSHLQPPSLSCALHWAGFRAPPHQCLQPLQLIPTQGLRGASPVPAPRTAVGENCQDHLPPRPTPTHPAPAAQPGSPRRSVATAAGRASDSPLR